MVFLPEEMSIKDLEVLVHHIKYIRALAETEPLKSHLVRELEPSVSCQTEEQIHGRTITLNYMIQLMNLEHLPDYIKETLCTAWR